jgi:F0F1-type ATP synthase assembly protein I
MPDGQPDPTFRGRDLAGLGGMLAGAVIVWMVLGMLVDHAAGTAPVWTLVGLCLGILTGVVAFVVRVRSVLK